MIPCNSLRNRGRRRPSAAALPLRRPLLTVPHSVLREQARDWVLITKDKKGLDASVEAGRMKATMCIRTTVGRATARECQRE